MMYLTSITEGWHMFISLPMWARVTILSFAIWLCIKVAQEIHVTRK